MTMLIMLACSAITKKRVPSNLAGTGLGYINAGVTVMKYLNIDAATTIDTVTLDGAELRRGVNIRVGVQFDY